MHPDGKTTRPASGPSGADGPCCGYIMVRRLGDDGPMSGADPSQTGGAEVFAGPKSGEFPTAPMPLWR